MSESKFNTGDGANNQNVDAGDSSVNILGENKYVFTSNSYYGTGGYRDGTYLVAHTRELFYDKRRQLSAYRNFMKPILDSLITPVFNEEAIRTVEGNGAMFETFLEDVSNNGEPIQSFVKQAVTYSRLHGVTFVVMDNYSEEVQPETQNEAIGSRIMPYVYIRQAQDVENYELDMFGNLISITFIEQPVYKENGETEARYRIWTNTYSQVLKKTKEGKYEPAGDLNMHGLGVLPVISLYSIDKQTVNQVLVEPPLYDVARLCYQLYNKDSSIIDQERAQAFANFYIQTDNGGNITLGTHNVIFIPMDTTIPPGYTSPDAGILAGLVDNAEKLKESIFQIAQQNGVYGIKEASSGIAMSYDFYAQEYQLKYTAYIATKLENDIADLFKLYTNTDFEYVVTYPEEYQPGNSKAIIETYKIALDMGVPQKFKQALYEKMARMLFSDEDETKLKEIIEDIYKEPEIKELPNLTKGETDGNGADGEQGSDE